MIVVEVHGTMREGKTTVACAIADALNKLGLIVEICDDEDPFEIISKKQNIEKFIETLPSNKIKIQTVNIVGFRERKE